MKNTSSAKARRHDQLARHREGIGNEPDQVGEQHEHEQREHEGKKLHALVAGGAAHRMGDELVGHFRDRLQPPRHHRARRRRADQKRRNGADDDEHEQRGIGEIDVMAAHADHRHQVLDLKLVDRIDLHGAFGVECVCSLGGSAGLFFPVFRAGVVKRGARNEPRGSHYIEHARGKAEQEKYNEPPGRDAEPAVDEPADAGTDHDARNEFAREPEALGVAGCSRRPIRTRTIGRSGARHHVRDRDLR